MKNSISVFALLLFSFLFIQCNDDDQGDCICIEIYEPVCGEDGIEYSNSCHAECAGVEYTEGFCPVNSDALVLYLGDPAVDGCGWVLEIATDDLVGYYRPDTLPQAFLIDSLEVNIEYKPTMQSSQCGLSFSNQIPIIELLEIEEK